MSKINVTETNLSIIIIIFMNLNALFYPKINMKI